MKKAIVVFLIVLVLAVPVMAERVFTEAPNGLGDFVEKIYSEQQPKTLQPVIPLESQSSQQLDEGANTSTVLNGNCTPSIESVSLNGSPVGASTEIILSKDGGNELSVEATISSECSAENVLLFVSVVPIWNERGGLRFPHQAGSWAEDWLSKNTKTLLSIPVKEFSSPLKAVLSQQDSQWFLENRARQIEDNGYLFIGLRTDSEPIEWSNTVNIKISGSPATEQPVQSHSETEQSSEGILSQAPNGLGDLVERFYSQQPGCSPCTTILQCLACIDQKLGATLFGNWLNG